MLRAVDQAVQERYGEIARNRILAKLPGAWGRDLRDGSINALVSYEIEMLDAYLEIATSVARQQLSTLAGLPLFVIPE